MATDSAHQAESLVDRSAVEAAYLTGLPAAPSRRALVPIPGTKTPRYLADNAGAADIRLSAGELAELDALPAPHGARY